MVDLGFTIFLLFFFISILSSSSSLCLTATDPLAGTNVEALLGCSAVLSLPLLIICHGLSVTTGSISMGSLSLHLKDASVFSGTYVVPFQSWKFLINEFLVHPITQEGSDLSYLSLVISSRSSCSLSSCLRYFAHPLVIMLGSKPCRMIVPAALALL